METLSEHVQKAIKQIIEKHEIYNYTITLSSVSKKGENYLGTLYRVEIIGFKENTETKLNLICKIPPPDWKSDNNMHVRTYYKKEIYIYNVVLKLFKEFQNEMNIPEEQKFTSFAFCYAGSDVEGKEFLILEDLNVKKFVMFDKNVQMDKKHVALVIKGLAKYHALSFVIRDQKPEIFHKVTHIDPKMYEVVGTRKEYYEFCEFGLNQALKALEADDMKILYDKVQHLKDNIEEFIESDYNIEDSENYRVISHGDCWNNNMMFRYQVRNMVLSV